MLKQRLEVLWVGQGVATIPPFRIDVGSAGEGVRFSTKTSRAISDIEGEPGKEFRPTGLTSCQKFRSREVFQILVIGNDLNRKMAALEE